MQTDVNPRTHQATVCRAEEIYPVHIHLGPTLSTGTIDDAIAAVAVDISHSERVIVDLSQVGYAEISGLQVLLAFIAARTRIGLATQLALPTSKKVRDFLRRWKFDAALTDLTGISLYKIVVDESKVYFGENKSTESMYRAVSVAAPNGVEILESRDFFSLTTFNLTNADRTAIATSETRRWEHGLVAGVIRRHLGGPEGYIPSRIVYEALTNSLRHPGATAIQTCSHFDRGVMSRQSIQRFSIVLWDDGKSIVDTLREVLDRGLPVRGEEKSAHRVTYRCSLPGGESSILDEDFEITDKTTDAELLLAATLPGVTRDPFGKYQSSQDSSRPGDGLFLLVNAVTGVYKGEVKIRTKDLRLIIGPCHDAKAGDRPIYSARIEKRPPTVPVFLGNLLTVRLPVQDLS